MSKQKIVIIVGPTASGKTSLGVLLAQKFGGEIISADSMQIYKGMDIGTAKVTDAETCGVPHYLVNIVQPTEPFNVSNWKALAEEKIDELAGRRKVPIIVGGTGLYVNALINNFSFGQVETDPASRRKYEEYLAAYGVDALYQLLVERDAVLAKTVDKNRTKVVIRYLEIIDAGGDPKVTESEHNYDYLLIGLDCNRQELYENINTRVDEMMSLGLVEEVKTLIGRYGKDKLIQGGLAIGYKEIISYLNGEITEERAVELIKQHSRNYAKRQITYLKKLPNVIWVDRSDKENIIKLVGKFLEKNYE